MRFENLRQYSVLLIGLMSLILSGCLTRPPPVPVEDIRTHKVQKRTFWKSASRAKRVHTVQPGDSLYTIALSYHTHFRRIAWRNGLKPPYTIYPGQRLIVEPGVKKMKSSRSGSAKKTLKSDNRKYSYKNSKTNKKLIHEKDGNSSNNKVSIEWVWPANGRVLQAFNQGRSPNKGIDILGRYGGPVYAAADGVVVYAGEGLRGYSKMLMILHEGGFLSAYGYNRRILVKENQAVKAGQQIAEIGSSSAHKGQLHFEIRVAGNPVDPQRHLPRRR